MRNDGCNMLKESTSTSNGTNNLRRGVSKDQEMRVLTLVGVVLSSSSNMGGSDKQEDGGVDEDQAAPMERHPSKLWWV